MNLSDPLINSAPSDNAGSNEPTAKSDINNQYQDILNKYASDLGKSQNPIATSEKPTTLAPPTSVISTSTPKSDIAKSEVSDLMKDVSAQNIVLEDDSSDISKNPVALSDNLNIGPSAINLADDTENKDKINTPVVENQTVPQIDVAPVTESVPASIQSENSDTTAANSLPTSKKIISGISPPVAPNSLIADNFEEVETKKPSTILTKNHSVLADLPKTNPDDFGTLSTPENIRENNLYKEILNSEPALTTQPSKQSSSGSNIFKTLFIISLFIFLAVASLVAYELFFKSQKKSVSLISNPEPTIIPTITEIQENKCQDSLGLKYNIGESYIDLEGCQTCTCESNLQFNCVEKNDCQKSQTATPSAVTSLIPSPASTSVSSSSAWLTYSNSKYGFEFKYPSEFITEEQVGDKNLSGNWILHVLKDEGNKSPEAYREAEIAFKVSTNSSIKNQFEDWYVSAFGEDNFENYVQHTTINGNLLYYYRLGGNDSYYFVYPNGTKTIFFNIILPQVPSDPIEANSQFKQVLSSFKFIK